MAGAHDPQPAGDARLRGRAADRERRRPRPGLADPEGGRLPRDRPPARRGAHHPEGTEPGLGPQRTVYAATAEGRGAADRWLYAPVEHIRQIRSELLLKLALLDRAGERPGPAAPGPARGPRADRPRRSSRAAPAAPASTRPCSPGAARPRSPPWTSSTRSRPPSPGIRSRAALPPRRLRDQEHPERKRVSPGRSPSRAAAWWRPRSAASVLRVDRSAHPQVENYPRYLSQTMLRRRVFAVHNGTRYPFVPVEVPQ